MQRLTMERLRNYIPLQLEVFDQLERIERMKSAEQIPPMKESTGAGYTPGAGDNLERAILNRLAYQDKITPVVNAHLDELESIRAAIDARPDPMDRLILRRRYIDMADCRQLSWKEISVRIYGDDEERHIRAAQRLHDKAVAEIPEN